MRRYTSQFERRSHFGLRLMGLMLFMALPALLAVAVNNRLVAVELADGLIQPLLELAVGALLLAGPVLFRDLGAPPGPSDEEGGGGPPRGDPPSPGGGVPGGGIPLPDAEQGGWRVRDHRRPGRLRTPRRDREGEPHPHPIRQPLRTA